MKVSPLNKAPPELRVTTAEEATTTGWGNSSLSVVVLAPGFKVEELPEEKVMGTSKVKGSAPAKGSMMSSVRGTGQGGKGQ